MITQPFFSICIPNYNYGKYLGYTIDSVLAQDFKNFEIIIQDNQSTDQSWKIIQEYTLTDNRIKAWRNNCNVGFAPNLNKATRNATGKYFILLSSDDVMLKGALGKYAEVIASSNDPENLIICSNAFIIDQNSLRTGAIIKNHGAYIQATIADPSPVFSNLVEEMEGIEVLKAGLESYKTIGIFCATCYPARLFYKVEGYDESYQFCPDIAFLHKLLMLNPKFYWVHQPYFQYRIHQQNQLNAQKTDHGLKIEIDGYRTTRYFSDDDLKNIQSSRKAIQVAFISRVCLYNVLVHLYKEKPVIALSPLFFGLSTYPNFMLRNSKFYMVVIALIGWPFTFFGIKIYKIFKKINL